MFDLRSDLRQSLIRYRTRAGAAQKAVCDEFLRLLDQVPDPFARTEWRGHVTASALVTDESRTLILLVKHRKLDLWLQPGGHVEAEHDSSVLHAALREVREETGLATTPLMNSDIFDLDIHEIPARSDAPAHLHFDVRYLVEAPDFAPLTMSDESTDMRWFSLGEALRFPLHPSQQRLALELRRFVEREERLIPTVQWMAS